MDIGFYKRARGMKHKKAHAMPAAMPFYPWPPPAAAPAAPAQAGSKLKPAAAPWPAPAPPPSAVPVEIVVGNGMLAAGGGGDDVDRRAAMYISRVQERLRRERMTDDWRKYY
ncbi:hypothetical protein ACP4OV_013428 [Aristida adscensionis]